MRVTFPIKSSLASSSFDLWTLEIILVFLASRLCVRNLCTPHSDPSVPIWRRHFLFPFFLFFFLGALNMKNVRPLLDHGNFKVFSLAFFNGLALLGPLSPRRINVDAWQSNKQRYRSSSMLVGSRAIRQQNSETRQVIEKYLDWHYCRDFSFAGTVGFIGYTHVESYSSISILRLSCLSLFDFFQSVLIHLPFEAALSLSTMATVPLMFFGNETSWFYIATFVCSLRPRPTHGYTGTHETSAKNKRATLFSLSLSLLENA